MDEIALAFKREILDFIKARKEEKIVNLLWKEDKKKPPTDQTQAVGVQLLAVLAKCSELDTNEINRLEKEKNAHKDTVSELAFSEDKFTKLAALHPNQNDENLRSVMSIYAKKKQKIEQEHIHDVWLDKYAEFASGVSFATHISKMSHPSISGASAFYAQQNLSVEHKYYLSTDSLANPIVDDAIDNAAYTPVSTLLKLAVNGEAVASYLSQGSLLPFKYLSEDEDKVNTWAEKFSGVFKSRRLATHNLAKQIYFPVDSAEKYHLLCNVKSSSMAHSIFSEIEEAADKKVHNLKKNNKFSEKHSVSYIKKAKLAITSLDGAKNISPLNSKRAGKITLFSCQPPTWQSQAKPPKRSFFNSQLRGFVSKGDIDYLRDFLIRFDTIDRSIKPPERKKWIDAWVGRIVDDVLAYAASIQAMEAGWSATEDIRLKREHQLFLDPYRDDEAFQAERKANDWQATICADFARWLNYVLSGKEKQFSPQQEHTRMWIALIEDPLREYDELIRMEVKTGRAKA